MTATDQAPPRDALRRFLCLEGQSLDRMTLRVGPDSPVFPVAALAGNFALTMSAGVAWVAKELGTYPADEFARFLRGLLEDEGDLKADWNADIVPGGDVLSKPAGAGETAHV